MDYTHPWRSCEIRLRCLAVSTSKSQRDQRRKCFAVVEPVRRLTLYFPVIPAPLVVRRGSIFVSFPTLKGNTMPSSNIETELTVFVKQVFEDYIRDTLISNDDKFVQMAETLDFEVKNLTDRVKELQIFHGELRELNRAFVDLNDRMARLSESIISKDTLKKEITQEIVARLSLVFK
jgi:hypothetical protein